jgi:hypothetical protein
MSIQNLIFVLVATVWGAPRLLRHTGVRALAAPSKADVGGSDPIFMASGHSTKKGILYGKEVASSSKE